MLAGSSRGPCDSQETREFMDALPALNGECRSQAESQSAVHHGAGISLLLTQATGEYQR